MMKMCQKQRQLVQTQVHVFTLLTLQLTQASPTGAVLYKSQPHLAPNTKTLLGKGGYRVSLCTSTLHLQVQMKAWLRETIEIFKPQFLRSKA